MLALSTRQHLCVTLYHIKHTLVSINSDTGISRLVRSREGDKSSRLGAPTASDLELMAAGVELGTGVCVCGMKGNDLVADKIVSRSNALGHSVGDDSAGLHEGCDGPGVGGALATFFLNFEPDGPVVVSV